MISARHGALAPGILALLLVTAIAPASARSAPDEWMRRHASSVLAE